MHENMRYSGRLVSMVGLLLWKRAFFKNNNGEHWWNCTEDARSKPKDSARKHQPHTSEQLVNFKSFLRITWWKLRKTSINNNFKNKVWISNISQGQSHAHKIRRPLGVSDNRHHRLINSSTHQPSTHQPISNSSTHQPTNPSTDQLSNPLSYSPMCPS